MPTRTSRLVVLIALLCSCVQILHAQSPDFYLRITQCDNIQARVSLNGQPLHDGSCGDQLDWRPVCVNDALQPKKNRLSFEISNVLPDDFHGSLTFQLLAADSGHT